MSVIEKIKKITDFQYNVVFDNDGVEIFDQMDPVDGFRLQGEF